MLEVEQTREQTLSGFVSRPDIEKLDIHYFSQEDILILLGRINPFSTRHVYVAGKSIYIGLV